MSKKVLIIGHARHGKDTAAGLITELFGLKFEGSSEAAARIFLFDALKDKYSYKTPEECFADRVNHRSEWFDLIFEYNKNDRARLAREILRESDCYVGMRSSAEVEACLAEGLFDLVIGVYDPRKPLEPNTSFNIDIWRYSDFVIPNASSLEDLKRKILVSALADNLK